MINLEIIGEFPNGVRENGILYSQHYTISLPVQGPATIDVGTGELKKEFRVPFPVLTARTTADFVKFYNQRRETRRSQEFKFPNELVANIRRLEMQKNGFLYWEENLTDWALIDSLRKGILYSLPEHESRRMLRDFAPHGPIAIVETSDGDIIQAERAKGAYLEGGLMPIPAGFCNYDPTIGTLERPFHAIGRENAEELGWPLFNENKQLSTDVSDLYIIGTVRGNHGDHGSWNPATIFVVASKLSTQRVIDTFKKYGEKSENTNLIPVPIDYKNLRKFAIDNRARLIDNGLGALLLYIGHRHGGYFKEELSRDLVRLDSGIKIKEDNPFIRVYL